MGIKSTYQITRETALGIINYKMIDLSDREIEEILESYSESDFRNYDIVDVVNENCGSGKSINSIYEFINIRH